MKNYLWTSEAVSSGHPDKVADQIADAILDAYLYEDENSRVACEVTLAKDLVLLTGEISSSAKPDVKKIARNVLGEIGYDHPDKHYDCKTVNIMNKINKQSSQISSAVFKENGDIGAGDQGMMFGFACDETENYMPLAHALSFKLINLLEEDRKNNSQSPFMPDAKTQATIEYVDGVPNRLATMVVSTCHTSLWYIDAVRDYIECNLIEKFKLNNPWVDKNTTFLINPAGTWTIGGPAADTGLSGRKIVVDNYGADCPIGGGSFSGKDATKVDRSGAYAARYIAKNIVAHGYAKKAQVQLAYAIGMTEPVSFRVNTFNSADDQDIAKLVESIMDLSPKGILDRFGLRKPIYRRTAFGGHFGRTEFPWEKIDLF